MSPALSSDITGILRGRKNRRGTQRKGQKLPSTAEASSGEVIVQVGI